MEEKSRKVLVCIFLFSFCVQLFFFFKLGVRESVDTVFYLENAGQFSSGILLNDRSIWYISFSMFLFVVFTLGGSLSTAVIIQILLAHLTAFCIYLTARKFYNGSMAGLIAATLYLIWVPIHEWNTFIYTESVFTSLCILSFAALVFSKNAWQYILTGLLFLFTFFIRPTGLTLLAGLIAYFLVNSNSKNKTAAYLPIGMLIVVLFLGSTMFEFYNPVPSYASAEIIYPKITLGIQPESSLKIPKSGSALADVILFAWYNPVYFVKLFVIKVALFYGNVKPYYSITHNILIVLLLYPLYFFAFRSLSRVGTLKKENAFMAALIVSTGIIVGLTTENWDGRFLVPVLPFVFILASGSIGSLLKKYFLKRN